MQQTYGNKRGLFEGYMSKTIQANLAIYRASCAIPSLDDANYTCALKVCQNLLHLLGS